MAGTKNLISFSMDFKKQYPNRPKPVRDEIDEILKDLTNTVQYIKKNSLPYRKIKMILRISKSNEALSVIVLPIPRIIIKRIE